jgi:L-iditol 2-dehydrogenase
VEETVKVVVFTGPGEVEVREEPSPIPGPDQVLVDVGACGICTFERRLFAGDKKWYPVAPGHEAAGVISAVGANVDGLPGSPQVGDRVTMDLLTRCGTCTQCRRGVSSLCRQRQGRLLQDGTVFFGGFASQVAIDARSAYPVGNAPVTHAAMGEPIACTIHSLRQGGLQPGDRVAIIGGGFMGRLHLIFARLLGAATIGIIDIAPERLQAATDAGADWVATPDEALEVGGKQDTVFVTAMAGVDLAIEMADLGGSVVLYSAFDKEVPATIGADRCHREEVTINGAFSQEPADWKLGSSYLRSGLIDDQLEALITARYDMADVADALRLVTTEPTYRVMVKPPSADD